jgi:hypothetical protein
MIKRIGIEVEMPITRSDYLSVTFEDINSLFKLLLEQGWQGKYDDYTKSLVGVKRTSEMGIEVLETDLGICTLEVALSPVNSLASAKKYWSEFRESILLSSISSLNLRVLGYGNQPLSTNLKGLIARKGHYQVYNSMFSHDDREWFLQNFPGLAAVQFNYEIPTNKAIEILNLLFDLSPLFWAGSINESISNGSLLPYKSQRHFAYKKIAGNSLTDRYGTPKTKFKTLCEYILRMWNLPIFEIVREGTVLRPENSSLTTSDFIDSNIAPFIGLEGTNRSEKIQINDLKTAIYFSWLDFRLKFTFNNDIKLPDLIAIVRSNNDISLYEVVDYIVIEIRPISMQSDRLEFDWMTFSYLCIENLDALTTYTSSWIYGDILKTFEDVQKKGLYSSIQEKTLGVIGQEVIEILSRKNRSIVEDNLLRIHSHFVQHHSHGDILTNTFQRYGLQRFLESITIRC